MPQPTPGDVHVDFLLTDLSVAYAQQAGFIADQIFPAIGVTNQSNKYRTYPRQQWFRTVAAKRAPATETPGSGWVYSTDSYFCDVWGVHKDLDDQTVANEDNGLGLDTDAVNFVTQQYLLRRDIEWASKYFGTGIWTTDLTGVTATPNATQFIQWDQSASTPIQDITKRAIAMQKITGLRPNTLVLGADIEPVILNHSQIMDRIKYTQRGVITTDLLASFFGVDRVLWATTVQNTGPETFGEAADSTTNFSFVFNSKNALLCYTNPNPGLRQVSAGYIFTWTGLLGAGAYGGRIKRFRDEKIASDRVEIEGSWDMKVVAPDLGVFWSGVIA